MTKRKAAKPKGVMRKVVKATLLEGTITIDQPLQLGFHLKRALALQILNALRDSVRTPGTKRDDCTEVSVQCPFFFVVDQEVKTLLIRRLEEAFVDGFTAPSKRAAPNKKGKLK